MGIYPYSGSRYDRYWKYENPDPSTNYYAIKVSLEILNEIQNIISKRGKQIYGVRPESILVQDLRHAVIRELLKILAEHDKLIEKYEQENSGNIENYFDSEGVEHVPGEETEDQDEPEEVEGDKDSKWKKDTGDDDMDTEFDAE